MAYTVTPNLPLNMPTPGTREPAQIALLNDNCVVLSNHDHTTGKALAVGRLRSGLNANRPAASTPGNVYFSTDTGNFYVDTGTAWVQFLTSGGQATVTGWTLIDPIIRDTLQFGPEGSGTIDAALTRPAANTLRTDNLFGVGVTPSAWGANRRAVQVGIAGAVIGETAADTMTVSSNLYHDGTAWKALAAGPSSLLQLTTGAAYVFTGNNPGAGNTVTLSTRAQIANTGTLTLTPDAGVTALHIQDIFTNQLWVGVNRSDGILHHFAGASGAHRWSFGGFGAGTTKMALNSTGSLTVTPDAGSLQYAVVIAGGGAVQWNETTNNYFARLQSGNTAQGSLEFVGVSNGAHFSPINAFHGAAALGRSSAAWSAVYAVNGTIQPSHIDTKEHIVALDPAACVEAVMGTQWWEFDYKPADAPQPLPVPEDETPEQAAERELRDAAAQRQHQTYLDESAATRHQRGYVLGSTDHQTSDLFGMGDRKSASPQTDLAVVACALQQALRDLESVNARVVALEARDGNAAAA
jgi:hypothetical protein